MQDNPNLVNPQLSGGPFDLAGGPSGVLLIHGFTATTAEVRPLGEILNRSGYTILAPLLPGHNTQPADLNKVTWQDWVGAAETGYQWLADRCEQVFVGGESTGGLLALYLASQHPDTAGVLAYAPALKLKRSLFIRMILPIAARFVPYANKPLKNDGIPWQGYRVNPLKGVMQLTKLQQIIFDHLPSVRQPLLIVQGRLDASVHPSVPAAIAGRVSADMIEIHWMPNSSHVVILDKEYQQVARTSLDFLGRIQNSLEE